MFGREEKLKRLEVQEKLSQALETIESLRMERIETAKLENKISDLTSARDGLIGKIDELKIKLREQSENDVVVASLRIIKSVIFDEKNKEDPFLKNLIEQQMNCKNTASHYGYGLAELGSLLGRL